MKDVFVVTHAQSEHHVQGVVGGWHDSELTELGHRQADAIAARIAELVAAARARLYTSDLRRAVQTADPIAARLGVAARLMPDLREKSFGVAGGRPNAWLDQCWVPAGSDGDRLDHDEEIEGAETRRELLSRVYRAMDEILADPGERAIIVTHGFALTFVIAAWFRLPIEAAGWIGFRPNAGGITHLQQDERFGDRAHLVGL